MFGIIGVKCKEQIVKKKKKYRTMFVAFLGSFLR